MADFCTDYHDILKYYNDNTRDNDKFIVAIDPTTTHRRSYALYAALFEIYIKPVHEVQLSLHNFVFIDSSSCLYDDSKYCAVDDKSILTDLVLSYNYKCHDVLYVNRHTSIDTYDAMQGCIDRQTGFVVCAAGSIVTSIDATSLNIKIDLYCNDGDSHDIRDLLFACIDAILCKYASTDSINLFFTMKESDEVSLETVTMIHSHHSQNQQPRKYQLNSVKKDHLYLKRCTRRSVNHRWPLQRHGDGVNRTFYICAGQSNMSGRGSIDDLRAIYSGECHSFESMESSTLKYKTITIDMLKELKPFIEEYADSTYVAPTGLVNCFDPISGWQKLQPNMHKNIDVLKTTGVGPGFSFGVSLSELCGKQLLGMIPVAIGATYLDEWFPDYFTNDGKTDSNGFIMTPANSAYQKGCYNIMTCTIRTIADALLSSTNAAADTNLIAGVLWYQGENDASYEDMGSSQCYSTKLQNFLIIFRSIIAAVVGIANTLSPAMASVATPLPIVCTAITTTRPLKHLKLIRSQQLTHDQSVSQTDGIGIAVIDAFGKSLTSDCIHLTTKAQLTLGIQMAFLMLQLQEGTHTTASAKRAIDTLDNVSSQFAEMMYVNARKRALQVLDELPHTSVKSGKMRVLRSGLKPINFVYGDLNFASMLRVLQIVSDDASSFIDNEIFVDLGSGNGTCIAAAMMSLHAPPFARCIDNKGDVIVGSLSMFRKVVGVELMASKVEECNALLDQLKSIHPIETEIVIINDNMLSYDSWIDGDVIYTCATCFAEDLLTALLTLFHRLKKGTRIIMIDSMVLSNEMATASDGTCSNVHLYSLIGSCQCYCSWGECNAFVYKKMF